MYRILFLYVLSSCATLIDHIILTQWLPTFLPSRHPFQESSFTAAHPLPHAIRKHFFLVFVSMFVSAENPYSYTQDVENCGSSLTASYLIHNVFVAIS